MQRRIALLFLMAGLTMPWQAFAGDTCKNYLEKEHTGVVAVLRDQKSGYEQRKSQLKRIFNETVDVPWVAHYVAGSYWDKASDAQRQEYVSVYRDYITHNYIGAIDKDDLDDIYDMTIASFDAAGGNYYESRAHIMQKNDEPVILDLKLTEEPAGVCHVRDFSIEGVSLLAIQRDEMQALGQNGGLPAITQSLKNHTAAH